MCVMKKQTNKFFSKTGRANQQIHVHSERTLKQVVLNQKISVHSERLLKTGRANQEIYVHSEILLKQVLPVIK